MMLSDVCLSVAYIGPKSRTERPRKTKISVEEAHVTRDWVISLSRSKGQRSRSPGCFGWLYWQTNMDIELVTDPDACMVYIVSPLTGLGGAYCGGLPPAAC